MALRESFHETGLSFLGRGAEGGGGGFIGVEDVVDEYAEGGIAELVELEAAVLSAPAGASDGVSDQRPHGIVIGD